MVASSPPATGERTGPGAVILSARGVTKSFGNFIAVDSVDLDVREGEIHALVGPNGAGKSTILNLLGGQLLPTVGEIVFNGRPAGLSKPNARARAGMGRSFQLTSIIPGFTCLENVIIAVQARLGLLRLLRLHTRTEDLQFAEELLEIVGLGVTRDVPAELLAHGQQR